MSTRAVVRKLGGSRVLGRRLETDADLIEAIRRGLPARALDSIFADLADEQISQATVYRLIGSGRTLQRKRTQNLLLSSLESDRLARLARMLVRAEEAIGDMSRSRRWLAQPNRALGGERPIDLLDSDTGTLAVERVLGRIEHGVYS
jgi:putative toxin-antitoxin system antitoxin component (TIGR02293 family)